jgi:hypothetical protein
MSELPKKLEIRLRENSITVDVFVDGKFLGCITLDKYMPYELIHRYNNFDNLLEALKKSEHAYNRAISLTKTGNARNVLTDLNILRLQAIAQAEKEG